MHFLFFSLLSTIHSHREGSVGLKGRFVLLPLGETRPSLKHFLKNKGSFQKKRNILNVWKTDPSHILTNFKTPYTIWILSSRGLQISEKKKYHKFFFPIYHQFLLIGNECSYSYLTFLSEIPLYHQFGAQCRKVIFSHRKSAKWADMFNFHLQPCLTYMSFPYLF